MDLSGDTFRAIAEQASDGIFVTDEELRIGWVNRRACQLLRMPPERIVGRRIADLLWPSFHADEPLRTRELRSGQPTMTIRHFRAGDGARVVLEVSAKSIGGGKLVGIARDATARLESEARLARSEASFRALIEGSPDAVVVHRDAIVVYANQRAATLFGCPSPESLVGARVTDLMHPDDRELVRQRLRTLTDEDTLPFVEERVVRQDGTTVTCSIGAVAVIFEGQPAIAAIARDVTEERRIQAALSVADRMASLGALSAGVAHEINNPLTFMLLRLDAISSVLGALKNETSPSEMRRLAGEIEEHVAVARDGAERVRRIVGDLRVFSRAGGDVQVVVDPRQPLELAIGMAAHELKHRARIVRSLGEVPRVHANEGRLAQVFVNLLLNAAQALPDDEPEHHTVHVRSRTEGGDAVIEIEDDGAGIPRELLPHLFEPFFTTKPVGVGTGLGLSICHGIVTALGGTIAVESDLGKGARVTVRIPGTDAPEAVVSASRPPEIARAPRRVLVVDDEAAIGTALAEGLRGFADVVAVESARAAQDFLENDGHFDAVLCDVRMPVMNGPELLQWIESRRPELASRVLFITGGRMADAERARLGEARVIEKPFDVATIKRRLETMRT